MRRIRLVAIMTCMGMLAGCASTTRSFAENVKVAPRTFEPTWVSLEQYTVPPWYRDAKFGIFVHWGPQTLAGASGSGDGTRSPSWKQLAAAFKGEKFDAKRYAELFKQAGAKYVVQVVEHHDAYALYNSSLTQWSSVKMGPKRDFARELSAAVRQAGLIYGASSHTEENWWFYSEPPKKAPPAPKPGGPSGEQPPKEWLDNWYARLVEIVEKYDPQIFWFDWCIEQPAYEPYLRKFAAYYYNHAAREKKGVVLNYKYEAFPAKAAVLDISVNTSRFNWKPEAIHPTPWQFDTWSSNGLWFWRPEMKIRPTAALIAELADVVSKNGNYLLNVTPDPDGVITQDQVNMLTEIGQWMAVNGEAIYGTRPWKVYGEGPTSGLGPSFKPDVPKTPYTSQDIRFTSKGDVVYAIVLARPENGKMNIKSITAPIRKVTLLGSTLAVKWSQGPDGLAVDLAGQKTGEYALVLKIEQTMTNSILSFALTVATLAAATSLFAADAPGVLVQQQGRVVSIENGLLKIDYDLSKGTYSATDLKADRAILAGAAIKANEFSSISQGATSTFITEPLANALGMGKSLLITIALPSGPKLLLRISLYNDSGFISLSAGFENTTDNTIKLKEFSPLDGATAFKGFDTQSRYSVLDGGGGGAQTFVSHDGKKRTTRNNLLVTFGNPGDNRSLVIGGLTYTEFEKYAEATKSADGSLAVRLYANDPVGKRIDPGTRYLPEDRFYIDFLTSNPFDALESYADRLRLAQHVILPVCRFPIVDTWFAQVPHFGGGEDRAGYRAQNDSVGAVEEMECVARSGFLKYAPVAVLIEPDLYDSNNQQGWWDDEHWQRGPSNREKKAGTWVSSHGQFVAPYETARKWAGAIKALGGIPMIYVQTGFRSQDYAEKFPQHMISNEPNAPHLNDKGEQQYRDKEKKIPRKLGYDYTDPGFVAHMRQVWESLRLAGVQGVKFDYPDYPFTGWPTRGGMEDAYSTTAMHYRNVFRLAREGLGPDCYLHERTLERGSDVTLGLVTSQRTEGDTDRIDAKMVSRVGLRWYKNRVVMNYDMDGKNPFHAVPVNRDGERAMWTMSYVVSGTLMVVPSFGRMTPEQLHDLSRIYPFHSDRQSARPVDAFTNALPQVYDFKVDPQWHQLTFYNSDATKEATIGVDLAGDTAFGALGLDPDKQYYIYDFWNDGLIGKVPGNKRFEQTLRPGEARMMSVHEAEGRPQVLATDRHIMQGLVDLLGCNWDEAKKQLKGVSAVVGGEAYRVIIATNGRKLVAASVDHSIERSIAKSRLAATRPVSCKCNIRILPGEAGLAELIIERSDNGPAAWVVTFE